MIYLVHITCSCGIVPVIHELCLSLVILFLTNVEKRLSYRISYIHTSRLTFIASVIQFSLCSYLSYFSLHLGIQFSRCWFLRFDSWCRRTDVRLSKPTERISTWKKREQKTNKQTNKKQSPNSPVWLLVSWCLEPSQPQRIKSGLNVCLRQVPFTYDKECKV